jgi:hypothetical protein
VLLEQAVREGRLGCEHSVGYFGALVWKQACVPGYSFFQSLHALTHTAVVGTETSQITMPLFFSLIGVEIGNAAVNYSSELDWISLTMYVDLLRVGTTLQSG